MMATVALFLAAPRTMDGPPMSIFSMVAASSAPERTVSANGYRLTTTRSNGLMPNFSSCAAWSSLVMSARMPAWICGSRVLTRPSRHSGKPVTSETSVTLTPSSARRFAVEPVETTSVPALMNASARTSMPPLWKTDTRARRIGRFVVVTLILLVIDG